MKKMILKVKNQEVIVSCPVYISKQRIDEFVESNKDWIINQLQKEKDQFLKNEDSIHILEKPYILCISNQTKIEENKIYVRNQKDFDQILLQIAKEVLPALLEKTLNHLQIQDVSFKIGCYRSQWGSCLTKKREIHLNAYLICTSYVFIYATIVHECAHLFIPNHSKQFYDLVHQWYPDYSKISKPDLIFKIKESK
ncbi:M48 family metallopeptidase [Floccifex sp.]|uniref:M48 family metallopeptidase n=1 Tax=Floccifex sp. TaxID=2815810 RepID=UPI003F11528C